MTRDGVIAFAQILPVIYIALHFANGRTPMPKALGATAILAACAETLLLLNIASGEEPETLVTWASFGVMVWMLALLAFMALRKIEQDHEGDTGHKPGDN